MRFYRQWFYPLSFVLVAGFGANPCLGGTAPTAKETLGKALFFDARLSTPEGQSCAACHGPAVGWTGPDQTINIHGAVYEGAVRGRFGNRKPPSAAYAPFSPVFRRDPSGSFVGGNFWDGRATGEKLGNPAADQAQGPFLNPLEQNNSSPEDVCRKVLDSDFSTNLTGSTYQELFERAFGPGSLDCNDPAATYDRIALAIMAFEASREVSPFSSKYDAYLKGRGELSRQERLGLRLFEGKAKCANCHSTQGDQHTPPLLTDFTYDNIGVPKNPENPFYAMTDFNPLGQDWLDLGLGGFLKNRPEFAEAATENLGKQKVPTLRNVDKRPARSFVKAYMHNGAFKSLKEVVHFYNTRDELPVCETIPSPRPAANCWPAPEQASNVNRTELGRLDLSEDEEDAIVAFLKTLSDGYRAKGHGHRRGDRLNH